MTNAYYGPTPMPVDREAGIPFRPAILLVLLLALVGMAGVIVVFGEGSRGLAPTTAGPGGSGSPSGEPVTISDPAALAPPNGVPVTPTQPGALLEWKTDQDWNTVLVWYYSSFPIAGMMLDAGPSGQSSDRGVPTGESHPIMAQGASAAPPLSPYLTIQTDPTNPTGSIVSYHTYN